MERLVAACTRLPPGVECDDTVEASLLPPMLMFLGGVAIVTVVIRIARRERPPLGHWRRIAAMLATVLALVATITALWAVTHEFQGGCTPLGGGGGPGCTGNARLIAAAYALGAGVVLWTLAIVVKGPRRPLEAGSESA